MTSDEEWYPVCLGNDLLDNLCREGFPTGYAGDNLFHLGMG